MPAQTCIQTFREFEVATNAEATRKQSEPSPAPQSSKFLLALQEGAAELANVQGEAVRVARETAGADKAEADNPALSFLLHFAHCRHRRKHSFSGPTKITSGTVVVGSR